MLGKYIGKHNYTKSANHTSYVVSDDVISVFCSDKPGQHDFNLLKKLVLPDGSILRAKLPGRPTRDCLFTDPARDGKR